VWLKGIQSEAYRKAQEVMGKADGESTRIYAEAYGRDPERYQFLKSMETDRKTLASDTTLLLSTGGEFLRYLKHGLDSTQTRTKRSASFRPDRASTSPARPNSRE
jgi:regulator of protease activity HflC (stomatin/prohibitin superfamily)